MHTRPLVDASKRNMRRQRIAYKQVTAAPELSETSAKRLFAEESFSVKRLVKVCEYCSWSSPTRFTDEK